MKYVERFMRFFFRQLYHSFAPTYDFVAAIVSFGGWNDWVLSILPFMAGTRILELGHGPGHLQRILLNRGLFAVGLDESTQMGTLAKRRLGNVHKLTRALAQKIPFASELFDSILSTFPSKYIFDIQTLSEAHRVLRQNGRFVVLLMAWPKIPLLAWLFKITGQNPSDTHETIKSKIKGSFAATLFKLDIQIVEVKSSSLLIVIASKEESTC